METLQTLDVRNIEPQFKHLAIFKNFNSLKKNNYFIIINDHDPKALYYKMSSLYPGIFSWEYLKNGPEEWVIKIYKTNEKEKTIGQMAAEDYKKATIFKNLGIDYCCEGKKNT
jgi:regulator of cell morphogenesis and NO signaling